MSEIARSFALQVPADPSLGVTVRVFVTESARRLGLGGPDVEDLRLAATELLANAVETGRRSIELGLRSDGERWHLRARGAGPLNAGVDALIDRAALLRGLADVREAGDDVEISSAVSASEDPD